MIITICGPPGSGKDTAAVKIVDLLKKSKSKLDYSLVSLGDIRREAAVKKGMTIEEFNKWSLDNPKEGDKYFDDYQRNLSKTKDNFVMVSRLGWHFIPDSFKVYIDVTELEGATRIYNQKTKLHGRTEENVVHSVQEQLDSNNKRVQNDKSRYSKLYGLNPYDKKHYDYVVDSTTQNPDLVAKSVVSEFLDKFYAKK